MNLTPDRLRALRAVFLPLSDPDRVRAALLAADLITASSGPAAVHCLGMQFKAYRRADAGMRTHAAVCYRVTCETARGRPYERIFHGLARLNRASKAAELAGAQEAQTSPDVTRTTTAPWAPATFTARPRAGGTAIAPSSSTVESAAPLRATLDALALHLWPFPEDSALPGLRPLWMLPHGRDGAPPAVVSYRPGARAVLRFAPHGDTPETYVKAFASADLARNVFERSRHIHAAGTAAFGSAPPLRLDADNAAVWHLGVQGIPFPHTLSSGFDADMAARMAQALGTLHALPHGMLPSLAVADQHIDAGKKLARLQQLCPRLEGAFLALRQSLLRDLTAATDTPEVALHGDFHLRQWLRQGDRITLCDFDEICLGAPETDLASLLMDLSLYGLSATVVTAWTEVLTRSYIACAPWGLRHRALRWQLHAQTINKMHRAYVQLQPGLTARCHHFLSHLATVLKALPQP